MLCDEQDIASLLSTAQAMIDRVRREGDTALVDYTRQFDAPGYTQDNLRATPDDFARARSEIGAEVVHAIPDAHDNIRRFHEEQMPEPMWFMEILPRIMAGEDIKPVASAGVFAAGGQSPLSPAICI